MKQKLYILFLISVFIFSSCKSQKTALTKVVDKNNNTEFVSYKIVTDSVFCKTKNRFFEFEYLDVKHHNLNVTDSINSFFFKQQYESLTEITDSKIDLNILKNTLRNLCDDEYDERAAIVHIDTGIPEVILNVKNIFTVGFTNYDVNGRGTTLYYPFSLKTGSMLDYSDVFNSRINDLISDLKKKAFDILKAEYENLSNNIQNDEEKYAIEELKEVIEEGVNFMQFNKFIIGEKGIEISISPYYNTNSYFYRNGIYSFDLTFKKIEQYLTDDFKDLISLN